MVVTAVLSLAAAWRPLPLFEALEMMGSGCDREIRYGEGSPWFDIVLPCGGGITLTLHKLRSAQPLLAVLNRLEQRKPAGLRYDPQAQSLVCLPTQTRTGWNLNGFEVGFRPCVRLMIYGRSLEAQATASLAAATGYDSHIFDLFPASASAQIDTDTAVILLCHDLNRELPVLQAAREAKTLLSRRIGQLSNPHVTSAKAPRAGMVQGRKQRKSGHPSGYSPKPGMRILWHSPCWQKSPLYVSIRRRIHACPRRPDPCGRAWRALSASGEIPISVSAGVSPRRLRLIAGHLKKTGELSTLRLNRRLRLMICV